MGRRASAATIFILTAKAAQDWPAPVSGPDGAYADCPCVRNTGNESLDSVFPDRVQVQHGEVFISLKHGQGLVPVDYGSSRCIAWDATGHTSAECTTLQRSPWCEDSWCFVNKTACSRNVRESAEFPGFFYSYFTCGFLDRFFSPASSPWVSTRPLYAHAFGSKAQLSPGSGAKFLDMFLHFAAGVLPRAGIRLEDVRYREELSNATRRKLESSYSGCVHDVALGNIDICLGDIWATDERLSFGTASFIQVYSEQMRLLTTLESKKDDLGELLFKPFSPFDSTLWGMIIAVVFATALAMVFFEFHRNDSDFPDRTLGAAVGKSMFLSLSSFLNAGTAYTSVTLSGRVITLGYGVFILICIATFTAETATALISKSLVQKARTIEDALEASASVCYSAGMKTLLEQRYPRMKQLGIPLDSASGNDFIFALEDGTCSYSIVGDMWMDEAWERGENCNLAFVGSTILSFPTGYYVSEELRPFFSWAVSRERASGAWSKVQMEYQTKSLCDKSTGDAEDDSDSNKRLDANNMLGACLVFLACLLVASLIRCCECACYGLSAEDKDLKNELRKDAKQLEVRIEDSASRILHNHSGGTIGKTVDHIANCDEKGENDSARAASSDETEEDTCYQLSC